MVKIFKYDFLSMVKNVLKESLVTLVKVEEKFYNIFINNECIFIFLKSQPRKK